MKKSFFKRAASFVLASAVAVSSMISASAENVITIKPIGTSTDTSNATRYQAYQIFNGSLSEVNYGTEHEGTTHHKVPPLTREEFEHEYLFDTSKYYAATEDAFKLLDGTAYDKEEEDASGFITLEMPYTGALKEYRVDDTHCAASFEKYLDDVYKDYVKNFELNHTMIDITWGNALVTTDTEVDIVEGDPYQTYNYDAVDDLLLELANINFTGKVTDFTVAENGTLTGYNGNVYTDGLDKFQWSFYEIYAELLATKADAAQAKTDADSMEDGTDEAKAAKAYAQRKALTAVDRAYSTAATKVARVLAGEYEYTTRLATESTPAEVGQFAESDITAKFLQKFAKTVAKVVTAENYGAVAGNVETDKNAPYGSDYKYYESDQPDAGEPGYADPATQWNIKTIGGYYLIIDTQKTANGGLAEGDSVGPYMLDVANDKDATLYVKSTSPTVTKEIESVKGKSPENVAGDNKTAIAGVGDIISYKLAGTLPENFATFNDHYYYRFSDTLDKSLTVDVDSVKVSIDFGGNDIDSIVVYEEGAINTDNAGNLTADNFSVTTKPADEEKTTLLVTFSDLSAYLEALTADNNSALYNVDLKKLDWTDITIIVEYEAALNEYAVVGDQGNKNVVKVIYSDDPNGDYEGDADPDDENPPEEETTTTTETKEDYVTVYTFEIDLTKQDGSKEAPFPILEGAGFTVTNDAGKTAVFTKDVDGNYVFLGWIDLSAFTYGEGEYTAEVFTNEQNAYEYFLNLAINPELSAPDSEGFDYTTAKDVDGYKVLADLYTEVFTNDNDDANLKIKGLDAGTYTFEETTVPVGNNAVDTFKVILVAEAKWTVTYTAEGEPNDDPITSYVTDYENYTGYEEGDDYKELGEFVSVTDYVFTGNLYYNAADEANSTKVAYPDGADILFEDNVTLTGVADGAANVLAIDPPEMTDLPGTGGIGVYIYYIAGGALVLLAGAALFLTRKKSGKRS